MTKLLSIQADAKTTKGDDYGVLTAIQYFAPSDFSGRQVCPFRTTACVKACLGVTAGRMVMNSVRKAQIFRTDMYFDDREGYYVQLYKEITAFEKKAARKRLIAAVRLNGTSDLPWHKLRFNGQRIFEAFPNVQFYDYSKNYKLFRDYPDGRVASNYRVVYSIAGDTEDKFAGLVDSVLNAGGLVAASWRGELPKTYRGFPVKDGDKHDAIFLRGGGAVLGLKAKGAARKPNEFTLN